MLDGLRLRQRRFVAEFCKDQNATKAAIAAGFNAITACAARRRVVRSAVISTATAYLRHVDAATENRGTAPRRDQG